MKPGSTTAWDAVVSAPGFALGILTDGRALARVEFLTPRDAQPAHTALAAEAAAQLAHYLKDATHRFDLPLSAGGSAHQNAVWAVMCGIPPGDTLTYGDVARRIASSPRAVGAACGANPLPVIIPCHRIVGAGGALGGFAHAREGFLPGIKRWLLAHEAAAAGFSLRTGYRARS